MSASLGREYQTITAEHPYFDAHSKGGGSSLYDRNPHSTMNPDLSPRETWNQAETYGVGPAKQTGERDIHH